MRALAVTPIHLPAEEIRRRQARYDRLAPPGLRIELRDVGPAAPLALESEDSVRASEREVAATLDAAGDGFDLAFPDCVLDPAVPAGPAAGPARAVPVNGLLKLSAMHLAAKGVRFGAVVRNEAIGAELGRRLDAYGLAPHVAGIAVMELPFDAIADTAAWNAALVDAVGELAARGAAAVINGCSAVDVEAGPLPARVIDPTALALRLMTVEDEADQVGRAA
ncbi:MULTISPECIES: aspartate/glutamate racemase family protein [Thermomonosporaceae]|uniref:aspartate/glutamate racemase family protein n=1 Tax=Thermomonosporaceae TaxID=2012 RepID=UPI00255B35AC|nr:MULTISPECIES: aspartate/glutamate racemase family protein [Thermomonosporaceae]MDL4774053.1 aspartate/glutamate racemase family protein [Actinomadura xylanilytica]